MGLKRKAIRRLAKQLKPKEVECLVIVHATREVVRVNSLLTGIGLDMAITHYLRTGGWSHISINRVITV